MISTIKFIDANIFIGRWDSVNNKELLNNLNRDEHCTSVLVLTEVYHKLMKKKVQHSMEYIRAIMGAIKVYDLTQDDLFNAMKNQIDIDINDRIHIAVMKRNNIQTIISFDTDFDKDKTVIREEI